MYVINVEVAKESVQITLHFGGGVEGRRESREGERFQCLSGWGHCEGRDVDMDGRNTYGGTYLLMGI